MDEIEKRVKFDLPQSLIDSELTQIIQQNSKHSAEIKKDKVNEKKKPTKEEKNIATRRVTLGLFFAEEGNRNKITVSEKEYQDAVSREAMNYPGKEQDFIKFLDNNPSVKDINYFLDKEWENNQKKIKHFKIKQHV